MLNFLKNNVQNYPPHFNMLPHYPGDVYSSLMHLRILNCVQTKKAATKVMVVIS